ncbi:BCCT family transporter [Oceanicaulis sp.]|uniref:BCCT family transporter n=1 Tax=Oceanicaulis sp. TaxID=1924941 RepID=UPI003D2D4834
MTQRVRTDWIAFSVSAGIVGLVCLGLVLDPDAGAVLLPQIYGFVAETIGPLYLILGMILIVFLVWLALSRFGTVRLGGADAPEEFNTLGWASMLFCAGIGAGLMYWAGIEWAYYFQTPPFGLPPGTPEAIEWASAYGLFHWGPSAWAFYCLPTLAIGYAYHNRGIPYLRLSTGCAGTPGFGAHQPLGRLVDTIFMVSLLGGAGTSLGFSTPMIAALAARILGVQASFGLEVATLVVTMVLFALSAAAGLRKGIQRLSDLNVGLIFAFLALVFIAGPTGLFIEAGVTGYGLVAQNFIRLNSWAEPFGDTGFVIDWTIFYWAWWIAYGPVVGLFVARISRGRTIRQVIFGMIGYGSLGAGLFFVILGNYGLNLQLTGAVDVVERLNSDGGAQAIVAIMDALPLDVWAMGLFAVAAVVFSATTYDSASYILASSATRSLPSGQDPALWQRLFWAAMLGALPITLLFVGGLRVVQTAALIASAPVVLIGLVMARSLMAQLIEDQPPQGKDRSDDPHPQPLE